MKKVVGVNSDVYIAKLTRYLGLVIPLVLLGYGLFGVGFVDILSLGVRELWMLTLTLVWLTVALWQFVQPSKSRATSVIQLSLYHLCAALYILFVVGAGLPFFLCWLFLLTTSYFNLQSLGVLMNTVVFTVVIYVGTLLNGSSSTTLASFDIAMLMLVIIIGFTLIGFGRSEEENESEFSKIKQSEITQKAQVSTIVNNLTDAVITTDELYRIRVYNASSLNLLDTNISLSGRDIDTVLTLTDENANRILPSKLFNSAKRVTIHDDLWYTFEDGEKIRLELTLSPIRASNAPSDGGNHGYIVILRDITRAKSLEEERDEFISVVSHELRTPITAVEGSLSNLALMFSRTGFSKTKKLEVLDLARNQISYLARMVNDLSTLSRAERGVADEPERIDVRQSIKLLYDTYLPEVKRKHLQFDLDIVAKPKFINVSRLYFEELMQNFITNAIRYTKSGSVTIKVALKGDKTVFTVKDTGIGISKPDQEKIFQRFYRSEDFRTRETGGTGLGLYVAAKLATKLDTRINLSSRLNHGSSFSFELPTIEAADDSPVVPMLELGDPSS